MVRLNRMHKLSILSPSKHEIGVMMAGKMGYNASGVSAQLQLGSGNEIVLETVRAVNVPLTGLKHLVTPQTYGGQNFSMAPPNANESLTIPAPVW